MELHGGCVIACQYCIRAGGTRTLYSWKIYWEHQNYDLLHPSMKSALRILALLVWVGGCERLPGWFGVLFPPCSNGQFLDLRGVEGVKSCLGNAQIDGPLFIKGFPQYD